MDDDVETLLRGQPPIETLLALVTMLTLGAGAGLLLAACLSGAWIAGLLGAG